MRTLQIVTVFAFVLIGCEKPMPEEAIVAMETAAADCDKCLDLVPREKSGACLAAARKRSDDARKRIPGAIHDYDEKSVGRYEGVEKTFKICYGASSGASTK